MPREYTQKSCCARRQPRRVSLSVSLLLRLSFCFTSLNRMAQAITETSLLMVGNSFTGANGLEDIVQSLLEEDGRLGRSVYTMRFQRGSSMFAEHAKSPALHSMVAERHWSWIVLQEQSEKPGFWDTPYEDELTESYAALDILNKWISDASSETVLMMTWARRTFDPYNPDIFPDFETMQSKVAEGYYRMQKQISTDTRPVPIAPVGLAFWTVYDSITDMDPTANGTDFSDLYADDHIHPSLQGSFLAACVVYSTLTGRDVTRLRYAPEGIGESVRDKLQAAAWSTVQKFNEDNDYNRQAAFQKQIESSASENVPSSLPYQSPDQHGEASFFQTHLQDGFLAIPLLLALSLFAWRYRRMGPLAKQTQLHQEEPIPGLELLHLRASPETEPPGAAESQEQSWL